MRKITQTPQTGKSNSWGQNIYINKWKWKPGQKNIQTERRHQVPLPEGRLNGQDSDRLRNIEPGVTGNDGWDRKRISVKIFGSYKGKIRDWVEIFKGVRRKWRYKEWVGG